MVASLPPFQHVIIVIQENRTPDNLFGSNPAFEPGVDIATSGVDSYGKTIPLAPTPFGTCWDLHHDHGAFVNQRTGGANLVPLTLNGTCSKPPGEPQFGFVDNGTGAVQPYFDIAKSGGFANRMFQTNQGPSFPAHQFLFRGTSQPTSDNPDFVSENYTNIPKAAAGNYGCTAQVGKTMQVINPAGSETADPRVSPCYTVPTLSDNIERAGLSWHYYANLPEGLWTAPNSIAPICGLAGGHCVGPRYVNSVSIPTNLAADIANCKLANVVWVTPPPNASDHAGATAVTLGPAWVASVVNAVQSQHSCPGDDYAISTAILITWDDWGGWYDHVSPPIQTAAWGQSYTYGFRVPLLVVSAYTPPGTVSNTNYDFGSILYFIEKVFNLGEIGAGTSALSSYADHWSAANGPLSDFFTAPTALVKTKIKAPAFVARQGAREREDD